MGLCDSSLGDGGPDGDSGSDADSLSDGEAVAVEELGDDELGDLGPFVVAVGDGASAALTVGEGEGDGSAYATSGAPISPTTNAAAARPASGRGDDDDADMGRLLNEFGGDSPAEIPDRTLGHGISGLQRLPNYQQETLDRRFSR